MKIREILAIGKDQLKHIEDSLLESKMMVASVLGQDKEFLSLNYDKELTFKQENKIKEYYERRKKGEPIAYIMGSKNFYGYDFCVEEGVLVPRFDTEVLVEKTLEVLKNSSLEKIKGLEIGVGTGIVSISLLKNEVRLFMEAVDINEKAIKLAQKNGKILKVDDRNKVYYSDLFENVKGKYDFIISNPPYIKSEDLTKLEKQIICYEPINALDGGRDGLDFYREIISKGNKYLNKEGFFIFEIGYDEGEEVVKILQKYGFEKTLIFKDLNKLDRLVIGMKF